MRRWPLRQHIWVDASNSGLNYADLPGAVLDGELWRVPVYAWEIVKSDRDMVEGQWRVTDTLRVYAPPGTLANNQRIGPDRELGWTVQGNPTDYNHGPGWQPGLVIHSASRVAFNTNP